MSLPYIYTPDVPQGSQQINNTQQPINANFQDIATLISVNHVPFNISNTFGKHNFVTYVEQQVDPSTAASEMALYAKAANDINGAELFYRYPNNGTVVQLTGPGSSQSQSATGSGGGYFQVSGSVAFGYPSIGYWQYLSNGIFIMSFVPANLLYRGSSGPKINPYTVYFPTAANTGNSKVPSFTQAPFNMQLAAGNSQAGTNCTYGGTIIDNTSASLFFSGSNSSYSAYPSIIVTVIGV